MKKNVLYLIIAVVVVISVIYSFSGGQSPEEYAQDLQEHREETKRFMSTSSESPFSENKEAFKGLNYYPANLDYKINARFEHVEKQQILDLPTNDGKIRQYLTYGYASFELDGKKNRLLILENVEEEELFLPFGDATSAIDTYGAGRYLDVTHGGGNTIVLDFNKAYNPFCAYSEGFTCPLPPKENLLEVAIEAGEKNY